jgi:sigma-B regulation protein RsbU (phosphoserine phosphatase)
LIIGNLIKRARLFLFRFCSKLKTRMNIALRATAKLHPRLFLRWLAIFCALCFPVAAQTPASPTTDPAKSAATSLSFHGTVNLEGPWRFQIGDDPRWADPGFDDSAWPTVTLGKPLAEQGIESYAGFGWYRLRLQPQQLSQFDSLSANQPLDLLVTSYSIGQLSVYINGVESGHTRGMTDRQAMYQSPPFAVWLLRPDAGGAIVLAIRSWAGPGLPINHGLLDNVEVGTQNDVAAKLAQADGRLWDQQVIAGLIVSFLFLCVAAFGAVLYLAQRHHSEYLWLALLCVSVAVNEGARLIFELALMPLPVFDVISLFTGRIFMAVTLEFVLRFTGGEYRRSVRIVQISVLLLPFLSLLHLQGLYEFLSLTAQVVFCALICVLLFRSWRRGRLEAGVMLPPFFLAATADSADTILDYFAEKHWISGQFASHHFHLGPIEFGTSTISYTVFLASLIAVILYRFVRVSQDEQRSEAEVAAARSVQSLLIPTQLPSNRHFMLESAYLPVNGVGGDFFQALPLRDDSLLIVVGDVSGKGLQAAMNSSTLVGALRNEISHDPGTILDHLNRVLLGAVSTPGAVPGIDSAPCFATCLCARIYPDGAMTISNAGHLSPYRDGREVELEPSLPLGVIANSSYTESKFQLNPGDRLVFLSDGVVEATNAEGELFGFERTQQVSHEPARYIAQTAKHFGQTDDITVVSLYFASRATPKTSRGLVHSS